MVEYYTRVLKEYEVPTLRKGREEHLKAIADGEKYCAQIVATADMVITRVKSFKE
jgi:hypothetical protein